MERCPAGGRGIGLFRHRSVAMAPTATLGGQQMASATNSPGTAKNYKALASYINTKELPWFEWFPGHYLKLCKLNPITGQIITFIRSVTGVSLDVHFHPGTVVVYTIQGAWTYDEGWVAEAGDVG